MRRFLPDTFTTLLIASVILAAVLPIHGAPRAGFALATKAAIALLFFQHGARLPFAVVRDGVMKIRLHAAILGVTFIAFPLLGALVTKLCGAWLSPPLLIGLMYLSVLPSTVQSSIALTSMAGGDVPAAVCSATLSNIVGMMLTPLLVGVLAIGGGEGAFSIQSLQSIGLQLLVPFALGQLVQRWIGDWMRARKSLLTLVDRGSILMVVYLAFSDAAIEGIWRQVSWGELALLVLIVSALFALAITLAALAARLLRFTWPDTVTTMFCGSQKSMASGAPMAAVLFSGQAIGGILLPLMLYHQIQLMACAALAQRFSRRQE